MQIANKQKNKIKMKTKTPAKQLETRSHKSTAGGDKIKTPKKILQNDDSRKVTIHKCVHRLI
jgi:hypothetical protein